jgi:hypothetical protein
MKTFILKNCHLDHRNKKKKWNLGSIHTSIVASHMTTPFSKSCCVRVELIRRGKDPGLQGLPEQ